MLRVTIVYKDDTTETFDTETYNATEAMNNDTNIREVIINELQN